MNPFVCKLKIMLSAKGIVMKVSPLFKQNAFIHTICQCVSKREETNYVGKARKGKTQI